MNWSPVKIPKPASITVPGLFGIPVELESSQIVSELNSPKKNKTRPSGN